MSDCVRSLDELGVRVESDDDHGRAHVLALLARRFALRASVPSAGIVLRVDRDDALWSRPLDEQEEELQLRLLMLLYENGRYGLHANGVADGENGFLLVGPSGSGKTTLALALLRAGWRQLGDDVVVLREERGEVLAAALRRRGRCEMTTLQSFPELHRGLEQGRGARDKWGFDAERVHPGSSVAECRPRVLLFPERSAERSSLIPLDRTSALTRLIEQSVGWGTGRDSSARHLAALRALVVQTESFRLVGGPEVLGSPERVPALLSAAVAAC